MDAKALRDEVNQFEAELIELDRSIAQMKIPPKHKAKTKKARASISRVLQYISGPRFLLRARVMQGGELKQSEREWADKALADAVKLRTAAMRDEIEPLLLIIQSIGDT